MSKSHKLAWAAGFFDGEGYITIQKRKQPRTSGGFYAGHYLRIGINHGAPEPLEIFLTLFGGTIRKQNPDKVAGNRKQRHTWQTSCTNAASALQQMLPYFANKNEVARLGLALQTTMNTAENKTVGITEELYTHREFIKSEIQRLNALD